MARPTHIPRYYADDKDIFDLLCQSAVTSDKLSEFLRKRGIIVSPSLPKEQVARYFQVSPLSWPQLEDLLTLIEREEREEKFSTYRVPVKDVDITRLLEAAKLVKESRAAKHGEVYHVNNRTRS